MAPKTAAAQPASMETYVARLESFAPQRLPKRRASNNKKKAPTTQAWPHDSPRPEELAFAGFFFKPTATSPDNVQCFICHRQLDGWESGDNPAYEHQTHSPDCGFAINQCIKLRNGDPNRAEEDPMSDKMMDARRATFADYWPYEGNTAYPQVEQLIAAGWCFDASPDYNDGVTCPYCNLSLDAWDEGDDPTKEHQRRSEDCLFFTLQNLYHQEEVHDIAPPKKRGSRASRTSTASRASTTRKKATTRGKKKATEPESELEITELSTQVDASVTIQEDVSFAGSTRSGRTKRAAAAPRKASGRSKKAAKVAHSVAESELELAEEVEHIPVPEPLPISSSPVHSAPVPRPSTTRGRAAVKKNGRAKDDSKMTPLAEPELESAVEVEEQIPEPKTIPDVRPSSSRSAATNSSVLNQSTRSTRGAKVLSSEGPEPEFGTEISVQVMVPAREEPPARTSKSTAKPAVKKATRKAPTKASSRAQPQEVPEPVALPEPMVVPSSSPPKLAVKSSKTKAASKAKATARTSIASTRSTGTTRSTRSTRSQPQRNGRGVKRTSDGIEKPSDDVYVYQEPNISFDSPGVLGGTPIPVTPPKRQTPQYWSPIDIDGVINSKAAISGLLSEVLVDAGLDKENMLPASASPGEICKAVIGGMTEKEKGMTVEQWILYNAERGEEKLRLHCESMIAKFKEEGERAVATLEGIEVYDE